MKLEAIQLNPRGGGFRTASGRAWTANGSQTGTIDNISQIGGDGFLWNEARSRSFLRAHRALGYNSVRVHLTFPRFMQTLRDPNRRALDALRRLCDTADDEQVYLDITCSSFWIPDSDQLAWCSLSGVFPLPEAERWAALAAHCGSVAEAVKDHPAVFCIDLVNEPSLPSASVASYYLNSGGISFAQYLTTDRAGRTDAVIAAAWLAVVAGAVRRADPDRLITLGLAEFGDFPNLTAMDDDFITNSYIDFVALHLYMNTTTQAANAKTKVAQARSLAPTKPIIVEEFGGSLSSIERRRWMLDVATTYACSGFFGGLAGGSYDSADAGSQELLRAKDTVRRFLAPDSPQTPGVGVLWLPPQGVGKTAWQAVGAPSNWEAVRGVGELPPEEPQLNRPAWAVTANPLPEAPEEVGRYSSPTANTQVQEFVYPVVVPQGDIRRIEAWFYFQIPNPGGVLPSPAQFSVMLKANSQSGDLLATDIFPRAFDDALGVPFLGWRKLTYNGPLSGAYQISTFRLVFTSMKTTQRPKLWLAPLKIFYSFPDPPASLRLGRIELLLEDDLSETVGSPLETFGQALIQGERKLRTLKVDARLAGRRHDYDDEERGHRLRRQVRALMSNVPYRTGGVSFGSPHDPALAAYVVPSQAEVSYKDGGPTFGRYQLSLSDVHVLAPRELARGGREQLLPDLRTGLVPRDYKKTLFSTDFANAGAQSAVYPPIGARDFASDTLPLPQVITKRGIDGDQSVVRARAHRDVIHYELPQSAEGRGDVLVLDTRGVLPNFQGPLLEADRSPAASYGWEEVYGPDQPLTGVPVLQNGQCRLRWASGVGGARAFFLDQFMYGVGFNEVGAILPCQGGSGDAYNPFDQVQSVTVAEYTPDKAVLRIVAREGAGNFRPEIFVTLCRGWSGPKFEVYGRHVAETLIPINTSLRFVPVGGYQTLVAAASGPGLPDLAQVRQSDVGSFADSLLLVAGEPWGALVRNDNVLQTLFMAFVQGGVTLTGRHDTHVYGSTCHAVDITMLGTTGRPGYLSTRFTIPATDLPTSSYVTEAEPLRNTGSATTSQVADGTAGGGQTVRETQAAATNDTLASVANAVHATGRFALFVRVKTTAAGAQASIQARFESGAFNSALTTTGIDISTPGTSYVWRYLGDASRIGAFALCVRAWRSGGSGSVDIDRVVAIPVEAGGSADGHTGGGLDAARDVALMELMGCQQRPTFRDR